LNGEVVRVESLGVGEEGGSRKRKGGERVKVITV
jgi:hypothetical protein